MANDDKDKISEPDIDDDKVNSYQFKRDLAICLVISIVGFGIAIPFYGVGLYGMPFLPLCVALFSFIAYKADRILHKQMRNHDEIIARLEAERKERQAEREEHQIQYDALCKKLDELEKQLQNKE